MVLYNGEPDCHFGDLGRPLTDDGEGGDDPMRGESDICYCEAGKNAYCREGSMF
jgi:hypothetical protein